MTRLPDFIILGQGKAGTSLIHQVLQQHPDIGVSHKKELMFFARHATKDIAWYRAQFAHLDPAIKRVVEVSPAYMNLRSIDRIQTTLGSDLDVGFVLRRPTEQAYSRYVQNLCARGEGLAFDDLVDSVRRNTNRILLSIDKCHELFGHTRVLPLSYEQNISGAGDYERLICDFLGVPFGDYSAPFRQGKRVNPGVMPHYVYGGPQGATMIFEGHAYTIPAGHLAFCAQPRNSWVREGVTPDEAAPLLEAQKRWTRALEGDLLATIHTDITLTLAENLETQFGYDMSHWRSPPKRIAYQPAPLPAAYLDAQGL